MSKKRKAVDVETAVLEIKSWFETVTEQFKEYVKRDTDHSSDYQY